eukprot:2483447-Prymnesium_polylepis.2
MPSYLVSLGRRETQRLEEGVLIHARYRQLPSWGTSRHQRADWQRAQAQVVCVEAVREMLRTLSPVLRHVLPRLKHLRVIGYRLHRCGKGRLRSQSSWHCIECGESKGCSRTPWLSVA